MTGSDYLTNYGPLKTKKTYESCLVPSKDRPRRIFFGRDPLGRRSLLVHKPTPSLPYILLASVSGGVDARYDFEELSTEFIFCLDLSAPFNFQEEFASRLVSLPRRSDESNESVTRFAEPSKVNPFLPLSDDIYMINSLAQVPKHLVKAVDDLIFHLDQSVMQQVQDIPQKSETKGKARVAVLFSGGIDSTVITYLAHRHIAFDEPIDLLNVAFENPRKIRLQAEGKPGGVTKRHKKRPTETVEPRSHTSYNVPDRITGLQELEELRRLCPERIWNFLQLEIDRIPTRNLGRDDRVTSAHGKETRHPFLSLTVLNFLANLPVHHKMDPRLEVGLGDKMLLRLAAWKLGLVEASQRKKRAMQFGSHSARMDGERRGDIIIE
ncbi:hypothetical protein C0991_000008 [Blastosporella zonata]|nr:hypothetical protein C0991_000008 [Blastosporella zonata]